MRILVTGSRNWVDGDTIRDALRSVLNDQVSIPRRIDSYGVTVVHGDASGADRMAERAAREMGLRWEAHRVRAQDWERLGKRAGYVRNERMVNLGADICLAFIGPCVKPGCERPKPHGSHGASHCADMAEAAGIPTRRYGFTGFAKGGVLRPNSAETDPIPFQPDNGYLITPDQAKRLGTAPLDRLLEGTDL